MWGEPLALDPNRKRVSGGIYDSEKLIVKCQNCEEANLVTAESEFGATIWIPPECPACKKPWDNDTPWIIEEL